MAVAKKAASKAQYYYADAGFAQDLYGPFNSVEAAQKDAAEEEFEKFLLLTVVGTYEAERVTTYKEVK